MNAAERRTAILALCLLLMGWGARALPRATCTNCGDLQLVEASLAPADQSVAQPVEKTPALSSSEKEKSRRNAKGKSVLALKPIAVNRASAEDLQRIKGVGPVLAKKIVEYRDRHGPLKGAKDLDEVPGIGKKKLDNLLPFLIFD